MDNEKKLLKRSIYEILLRKSEYEVQFKWLDKNTFGEIDYFQEKIFINIYLFLVEVYIHEMLHERFADLSEKQIKIKTDKAIAQMTKSQIMRLAKQLLRRLNINKTAF